MLDIMLDSCSDMFLDSCSDMFLDSCSDMFLDSCSDMFLDSCSDMFLDSCSDMFPGSQIVKEYSCAQTKATELIKFCVNNIEYCSKVSDWPFH